MALVCSFLFTVSAYAEYTPLRLSGAGKDMYAVQEDDVIYAAPKLLELGKRWKVEAKGQSVLVRPNAPGTKAETEVEIPVREIDRKQYIDFSFFSKQAGIDYTLNRKKNKLSVKPGKNKKIKKQEKGGKKKGGSGRVLLWDPDMEFEPLSDGFTAEAGHRWIAPEWGSYSSLKKGRKRELDYIKKLKKADFGLLPLVHNDFDPDATGKFLHDSEAGEKLTDYLTAFSAVYDFDGWNIDFENMYEKDRDAFTSFMKVLSDKLHQSGKESTVNITVYNEGSPTWSLCYDRRALAEFCDYEVVMGYDQTSAYSRYAGSVAAADWLDENLQILLKQIPADRMILGLPLYTRVWRGNPGAVHSDVLTVKYTESFLQRHHAGKVWDDQTKQYISRFTENGTPVVVWLEDERSLQAKIDLIHKYKLSGMAFWRIGFEKDGLFRPLEKAYVKG